MKRTIQKPLLTFLLMVVLLITRLGEAQMASQQPLTKGQAPIAMSSLPSGGLVVLGSRGSLSVVTPGKGDIRHIKQSLGYYNPADIAAAHIDDNDVILVAMYSNYGSAQQSVQRRGILAEYSLSGQQLRTWPFVGRVFDAVAADSDHKVLYLAEGLRGQVSLLSLDTKDSGADVKTLQELPAASRIGALAIDPDGQRLFVADSELGRIYVLEIGKRSVRTLVSSLGEPAALTYDRVGHNLFVADAARRCIWRIAVDDVTRARAVVFSSAPEFREPRGIAMGPEHNVWVADFGTSSIFELGSKGEVLEKFSP
jgi:DNA-binding beta-propeller fold protein YncE